MTKVNETFKMLGVKELKTSIGSIEINWEGFSEDGECPKRKIMSDLIHASVKVKELKKCTAKEKVSKFCAFQDFKQQLIFGYMKFFDENESFEAICTNKQFRFLGINYDLIHEPEAEDTYVDYKKSKVVIATKFDPFEHVDSLTIKLSDALHEIMYHTTNYQDIPQDPYNQIYSVLHVIYENKLDSAFFNLNEELRFNQLKIGLNNYKLEFADLPEDTYGRIKRYNHPLYTRNEIQLNRGNDYQRNIEVLIHEMLHGIFAEYMITVSDIFRKWHNAKLEDGRIMDDLIEEEIVTRLAVGLTDVFLNNDANLYSFFSRSKPELINLTTKMKGEQENAK